MNKELKEKIEEAAYNYCHSDQYPTGFSGFKSGATFGVTEGFRLAIELIKPDEGAGKLYASEWAYILEREGQRLGILPKSGDEK